MMSVLELRFDTIWVQDAAKILKRSHTQLKPHTMKRILAAMLLILIWSPNVSFAQLGVAAGLNFDSMSDISGNRQATFDNATGYHVGLFYNLGMGPVGMRVGAFYRDISGMEMDRAGVIDSFDLTLIDVPIDLRFNLTATPVVRPYLLAGQVLSFPSSSDAEYDNALEKVSVAGNVGGGLALSLGGVTLFPEIRYVIGVSRFMKDKFEIGGFEFDSNEAQRQNSVMLRLGIGF